MGPTPRRWASGEAASSAAASSRRDGRSMYSQLSSRSGKRCACRDRASDTSQA